MTHIQSAQRQYTTAYQRWALELSHDKNEKIAKDISAYICEHSVSCGGGKEYWKEVKRLIETSNHTELYKPL
jgi:hypothetical protein